MRRTKIIATLGPATESPEKLKELIQAGVNVFRLNMSHANHDWVRNVSRSIRKVAAELGTNTAILMDTQGPAIRTGDPPRNLTSRSATLSSSLSAERAARSTTPSM
jgi:pyruvate kinase